MRTSSTLGPGVMLFYTGLALMVAGCSSRSPGNVEPETASPITERMSGGCAPATVPRQLPPVEAILDTSALTALLMQGSTEAASTTVSVVFTGVAVNPVTVVRETELDQQAEAALKGAVGSTLRGGEIEAGPWAVRLRITTGEQPYYEILRPQYCPPRIDAVPVETQVVTTVISSENVALLQLQARDSQHRVRRMRQYRARCLIARNGNVSLLEVVRSAGTGEDDDNLSHLVREASFRPATLDGVPVPGWWTGNPLPAR